MAVKILHARVICFIAIHATKYEGYSYWWNSKTLRQMLNLDNDYLDNTTFQLTYMKNLKQMKPKEVTATFNLG